MCNLFSIYVNFIELKVDKKISFHRVLLLFIWRTTLAYWHHAILYLKLNHEDPVAQLFEDDSCLPINTAVTHSLSAV
jgi:hypothetical protein